MPDMYRRRVEQEWALLALLAGANPTTVEIRDRRVTPDGEVFAVTLHRTPGLVREGTGIAVVNNHDVGIHFRGFFPAVPIEVRLFCPVFHPNVHPESGFVCLWDQFAADDTVIEAICRLQGVITWALLNEQAVHLMQPGALAWFRDPDREVTLPLASATVTRPVELPLTRNWPSRPAGSRRRIVGSS